MDHDELILLESEGIHLFIRRRYEQAERMIVHEVQTAYAWDFPITAALDVGAHIGSWTLTARQKHPSARIIAVEVEPDNFSLLAHNTQRINGVQIVQALCGYTTGDFVVGRHRYNSGSHRIYERSQIEAILAENPNWDFVDAPVIQTPEALLKSAGLKTIDVLKLDCEGGEIDILRHMSADLLASIQHIVGEIHTYPPLFEDLIEHRLEHTGFKIVYTPHPANPQYSTFHAWRDS
jgi:FkbM family methyltransferase